MKRMLLVLALAALAGGLTFASGEGERSDGDWTPSRNVEWVVTSSPGGGSSIFTQTIVEIITAEELVDRDILINYQTDGGGAVGRRRVSRETSAGHTILTFNNGDLQPLVQVEGGDLDMFTPLAVMATDGQILLVPADSPWRTAQEFIDHLQAGNRVIMGGSRGDDINLHRSIVAEVGGDIEYLQNASTGDALTQILGGNTEIVIAKPAAAFELVSAGELRPLIAATRDGFGAPFAAPTFLDLGFDISLTVYRGIVGPADMPAEAVRFWSEVFARVVETERWQEGYLGRFLLTDNYLPWDEAAGYMQEFEDGYTDAR